MKKILTLLIVVGFLTGIFSATDVVSEANASFQGSEGNPGGSSPCGQRDTGDICYSLTVYHYWALDFVATEPLLTLDSPTVKNSYSLVVDLRPWSDLYSEIIHNTQEEDLTELQNRGLEPPEEKGDILYFYYTGNPSNYIRYDGKIFLLVTTVSGEFNLCELKGSSAIWNDILTKIEIVEKIVRRAIDNQFRRDDISYFYRKYAPLSKWELEKYHIFTRYVVNIKNTDMEYLGISQALIDYLKENLPPRCELVVYPEKYTNLDYVELRGQTDSIILHDDAYRYDVDNSMDKFDMFILLIQIERICNESLDMLNKLKDVPNSKEENFQTELRGKWSAIRSILAFTEISTLYIEKHKSLISNLSNQSNDERWMVRHRYMTEVLNVEPRILDAKTKAINYDSIYYIWAVHPQGLSP